MNIFAEIWVYNYLANIFTLANAEDSVQIQLVGYQCWYDSGQDLVLYTLGGMRSSYEASTSLYKINLIETNGVYTTSTALVHNTSIPVTSEAAMIKNGDFVYVVFGTYWKKLAFPRILVFNYKTYEENYITLDSEFALYGHTAIQYGDSIYIIGGSSTIAGIELGFIPNNNFYKLRRSLSDPVYLDCSDGTIEPDCVPCPAGQVFQNFECVPCPTGRFSTSIASTSYLQCSRCVFGTYNSAPGATYCIDCPSSSYCPIGSSFPTERNQELAYQSLQPRAYEGPTAQISMFVSNLWYGAFGIVGLVFLIALSYGKILRRIKQIDLLVNQHDQELNTPVVFRKTEIGGLFTMFFFLAAGIIVTGSFLTFYLDNITENKSLVPVLLLENDVTAEIVTVSVSFYVYGGKCAQNSTCISSNNFLDSSISYTSREISCVFQGSTCTIQIIYTGFSLSPTSSLSIQMLEDSASATSMSLNVTSASSIPDQPSSVYLSVYPGSDLLIFLGTRPTVVTYEFTPSVIVI